MIAYKHIKKITHHSN